MKLLRLAPENTKFPFMRFRRVSYPFSAVMSILSVVLFLTLGMNFGIDFAGGTLIELRAHSGVADIAKLRALAEHMNIGDVEVQGFGSPAEVTLRSAPSTTPRATPPRRRRRSPASRPPSATITTSAASRSSARASRANRTVGHARRRALDHRGAVLPVVPLRVAVRGRRDHRHHARSFVDRRLLLADPARIQHDLDRGHSDDRRLFAERDRRRARPHPRNDAQIPQDADRRIDRPLRQRRAAAHDHDRDDSLSRAALARCLRRAGHPLLLDCDDLGIFVATYSSVFICSPMLIYLGLRSETVGASRSPGGALAKGQA